MWHVNSISSSIWLSIIRVRIVTIVRLKEEESFDICESFQCGDSVHGLQNLDLWFWAVIEVDYRRLSSEELTIFKSQMSMHPDPFVYRERYLPKLPPAVTITISSRLLTSDVVETSEAHRRSSKGLCGLYGKQTQSVINAVIQYYSNIPYFRHILKRARLDPSKNQN